MKQDNIAFRLIEFSTSCICNAISDVCPVANSPPLCTAICAAINSSELTPPPNRYKLPLINTVDKIPQRNICVRPTKPIAIIFPIIRSNGLTDEIITSTIRFVFSSITLCITIPVERVLCQMLSPLGQARGDSRSPAGIFRSVGISEEAHVGMLGWKSFCSLETPDWEHTFEVPSFLVDALREVCPDVRNANGLMMDNQTGLRMTHGAEELVLSELASTKASRKTWDFIRALRPGQTELEASQGFNIDGEPCPTHPNICFKGRGILSPDPWTRLEYGRDIAFGMGYRCAQIHRVSVYARDREEFEKNGLQDKVWQYFTVVPDFKSVGIRDNARTFEYPVILRAVNTVDAMTATVADIPFALLEHITQRITAEVQGVNRVLYDLTPKPSGTIEWE